jgi:hypothetical protein
MDWNGAEEDKQQPSEIMLEHIESRNDFSNSTWEKVPLNNK